MTSHLPPSGNPPPASVTGQPVLSEGAVLSTERNRAWAFAFAAILVALVEGIAIWSMLPLKTSVPYFIEVDRLTGEVRPSDRVATRFNADKSDLTLRYFMNQWAKRRLGLDPEGRIAEKEIALAYVMTSGAATAQFDEWLDRERPFERLKRDPGYSREVDLLPASFLSKNAAVIDATVTEQMGGITLSTRRVRLTLHFTLIPPADDADQETVEKLRRINPIGFYVTHFSLDDIK
ncbi:MAG: type IV secretion system protein [Gammaproteobacteria bacterium]|nr:type IV secretion system protein [Gammaproteobacteria bacterium]